MTIWNTPQIDPYYIPKSVGTGVVKSKYLINYYDTPYTAKYWRDAIDRAINYSDLYYYGVLQSWAIQSSPFWYPYWTRDMFLPKRTSMLWRNTGK